MDNESSGIPLVLSLSGREAARRSAMASRVDPVAELPVTLARWSARASSPPCMRHTRLPFTATPRRRSPVDFDWPAERRAINACGARRRISLRSKITLSPLRWGSVGVGSENSFGRNAFGCTLAVLSPPSDPYRALNAGRLAKPIERTPDEVARYIRAMLDGTAWDYVASIMTSFQVSRLPTRTCNQIAPRACEAFELGQEVAEPLWKSAGGSRGAQPRRA